MSRKILVMTHTGRRDAKDAARQSCAQLHEAGLIPVLSRRDLEALRADGQTMAPVEIVEEDVALRDIELVMVLGLKGSKIRYRVDAPLGSMFARAFFKSHSSTSRRAFRWGELSRL